MNRSRFLSLMLAVPMALLLLSCDNGGDSNPSFPPINPGGDGHVSVQATGGSFFGFEVNLTYSAAVVTPDTPLSTAIAAAGGAIGSTCAPNQVGTTLTFGCAKSTAIANGEIATFAFSYPGRVPTAADFTVNCAFYDENGVPVARNCTATWVN